MEKSFVIAVVAQIITWLQNKWSYQCKSYNSRTSLRSDTIMESSKLSFYDMIQDYFFQRS